jgi:hypothetical protein
MDVTLVEDIQRLANELGVENDSFLFAPLNLDDPSLAQTVVDGLTLAFVTYGYHHHPRGENVYELMEQEDDLDPASEAGLALERRIEEAAALQIPFIVTLNRLLEDYFQIRRKLEQLHPPV